MRGELGGDTMDEASWRRHLGGGRHHGGTSWMHMGDIWEASRRTSWRSILEEGGIMEEHPGSIWETSGRHQEGIRVCTRVFTTVCTRVSAGVFTGAFTQ